MGNKNLRNRNQHNAQNPGDGSDKSTHVHDRAHPKYHHSLNIPAPRSSHLGPYRIHDPRLCQDRNTHTTHKGHFMHERSSTTVSDRKHHKFSIKSKNLKRYLLRSLRENIHHIQEWWPGDGDEREEERGEKDGMGEDIVCNLVVEGDMDWQHEEQVVVRWDGDGDGDGGRDNTQWVG